MAKRLQIEAIFKAVDRMSRPVTRMQNRIRRFSKAAKRNLQEVGRAADKVGRVMKTAIVAGIKAATVAVAGLGVAAGNVIKTGADFERTLVIAATKFPGNVRRGTKAFEELEAAAIKAGKTTEFTASQSAEGLKLLGAAGLDVQQAIAVLPDVINLATVAEVELAEASDMAVKTLGAMGLASDDAAENQRNLMRVMDVMNNTANSASQTLTDVFEAMRKAGPIATTFGQDIETVGASIIGMARAGFVGEEGGTAYRNMMLRLAALTPAARREIKKLGVQLLDTKGNLKDPIRLMGDLSEALEGLGTGEKARRLDVIFGKKAIGPAVKLLEAGTEKLRGFEKAGREAAGSLTRSAEQIQDTTTGSMRKVMSAVEGVQISLFKLKDDAIKKVIDRIAEWIRKNEKLIASKVGEWIEYLIKNFDEIVSVLKTVGTAVGSIFLLIGAIKLLNAVMAAFNALLVAANLKLLLLMAIVVSFALIAKTIAENWEFLKASLTNLLIDIKFAFRQSADEIAERWEALKTRFAEIWAGLKKAFWTGVDAIVNTGPVKLLITAVKNVLAAWKPAGVVFKSFWEKIVNAFKWGVDKIKALVAPLTGIFDTITGFVKDKIIGTEEDANGNRRGPLGMTSEEDANGNRRNALGAVIEQDGEPIPTEAANRPRLVSPQESAASFFRDEKMTTITQTEVTIRDDTGRAEVTGGKLGPGLSFEPTGTF